MVNDGFFTDGEPHHFFIYQRQNLETCENLNKRKITKGSIEFRELTPTRIVELPSLLVVLFKM